MKDCIVIGKTNVGKTLFALHFAEFLGVRQLEVDFATSDGSSHHKSLTLADAVQQLTSERPHQTLCLQRIEIVLPVKKGKKRFGLVDTSGLTEGIHPDASIRRAMAQTLAQVREAGIILHMVDAANTATVGAVEALGEVDFQVAQFGAMRGGYAILANKMDLPLAPSGLRTIRREFPGHTILPISALLKTGFSEVKEFVWRNL